MGALPVMSASSDLASRVALHVLNRLGYGPRPGDVKRILDRGIERHIQAQLAPTADPDLDTRLRGLTTLGYTTPQILNLYNADQRAIGPIVEELYTAKLIRAVHSSNQLLEVMVDFWFNHFNVNINDGFVRYSLTSYERDAIRPHALGKFRSLLGAVAAHPAMLYYLDNYLSTASRTVNGRLVQGLNENYGRELLELHTLGVDAGYTQEHVFDAARAFTGWTIDNLTRSGLFLFRADTHDRGAKSIFGLNLPSGGLRDDAEKLLDHLCAHPATAQFVSRRLASRLAADDPPASLVSKMAETFLSSGGDIPAVIMRMVGSTEFWAEVYAAPSKPKTPIEFVVSAIRAVDGQVSSATRGLTGYLANLGMPLYQCIPPTGYSNRGSDWIDASSQLYRMNFALDLTSGQIGGVSVDARALAMGADPGNPKSLAKATDVGVFGDTLSQQTLDAAARVDTRSSVSAVSRVNGLILAGPEFQVR